MNETFGDEPRSAAADNGLEKKKRGRLRRAWIAGAAAVGVIAVAATAIAMDVARGPEGSGSRQPGPVATQAAPPPPTEGKVRFSTPVPTRAPRVSGPPAVETPSRMQAAAPDPDETWHPGAQGKAVGIDEADTFETGVRAEIVTLEAVDGVAAIPGEVAGPALRITVELTNSTSESIDLDLVLVQLYYGEDATPGIGLSGPGAAPFAGVLEPGYAISGTYVITCPPGARDLIQVTVSHAPEGGIVAFEGAAPSV